MSTARRVTLLAAALLTACASSGPARTGNPFEPSGGGDQNVTVTIENQNYKDATIWALWGGTNRVRVGDVTGNTTKTFQIRYRNDNVQFEVDYVAGGGYVGDMIGVNPGDHLSLTLRPNG